MFYKTYDLRLVTSIFPERSNWYQVIIKDGARVMAGTQNTIYVILREETHHLRTEMQICRGGVLPPVYYAAFCIGISAAFNIFSMKMPCPVEGSLTRTCVTAPTSLPFCMMGEPLRSVVNRGQ